MATLSFSKPVQDLAVGHLYEHIYCDAFTEYLRSNNLFSYVDYYLNAKTYHEGYVVLEIDVYNDDALELIELFIKTPISINSDLINGGLLQIMAEFTSDIKYMNEDLLDSRLEEYSKSSWKKGHIEMPNNWKVLEPAIEYDNADESIFGIIEQTITVRSIELPSGLWPLYLVVSKALRNNLIEDITANAFCFSYADVFNVTKGSLADTNFYRVDKRQASAITIEREISSNLLRQVAGNGFTERLGASLRNAKEGSFDYPVTDEVKAKMDIDITGNVWGQIATDENIRRIIELVHIDFAFKD